MKRNLLTILLAFFVAFSLNAQKADFVKAVKSNQDPVQISKSMKNMISTKAVIFFDDFESDMGWTLEGTWERDVAVAEPGTAYSGSNILANPLGVDYIQMGAAEYATSPVIDCSGETAVTLTYQSFSGCENDSWDHMGVQVFDGTSWVTIWDNGDWGGSVQEDAWTYYEFDVSAYAAGNANFQIRFYLGTTDSSVFYSGWGLDDVSLTSPEADDLGVDFVGPSGVISSGATITPTVTVHNYGSSEQSTFDVTFVSDPAGYDETVSDPGTVAVGGDLVVTFPDWTPADGVYTLTGTVILAGDANATNDVLTSEIDVRGVGFGDIISTFTTEAAGCPGIETDGMNIYTVYWNPAAALRNFDKYDMDGNFVEEFEISGVSAVRDMAFDGTYFYGAAASTSLFQMDMGTQTLVSTITAATACRAIAYDDDDVTFWANNWDSPLTEFDMTGAATGNTMTVPSIYGAAYDNWTDPANPTMWVFQGTGGGDPQWLVEFDMAGTATGRTVDLTVVPGFNAGIAGGLASYEEDGVAYLLANLQQDPNLIVKVYLASTVATAPITFTVDNTANTSYTGFSVKGSWDGSGNYDDTWSGGNTMMYDDGTNGDVTAGDDIWTCILNLVPDAGVNTWEWGVNDQNGDWIDGNWQFTVVDETAQALTYATVGVNAISAENISIYPNPSNGIFNVNVESNYDLEVLDITGKVINTQVLTGNSTVEINTAGVYFLRFSNEEGSVTQRVIVQ